MRTEIACGLSWKNKHARHAGNISEGLPSKP